MYESITYNRSKCAERIKKLRLQASAMKRNNGEHMISQAMVAERLGIHRNSYIAIETGKRDISLDALCRLCEMYIVSADFVLGISENKLPSNSKLAELESAQRQCNAVIDERRRQAISEFNKKVNDEIAKLQRTLLDLRNQLK